MAGVEMLTGVEYERIEPDAVVVATRRRDAADRGRHCRDRRRAGARDAAGRRCWRPGRAHVVIGGAAGAAELDAERAFREGAEAPAAIAQLLR